MKKLILLIIVLTSLSGFAQDNIIKLGVFGASYGDFSLTYERKVTPKSAINFTIGYMNPNLSVLDWFEVDYSSSGMVLRELKSGFHSSFDYRFYLGEKEALNGFYIAPYLRYINYNSLFSDEINGKDFNVDVKFNSAGLGFQMGYQWIVHDNISIDWYFLGIEGAYMWPKAIYTTGESNFDYSTIKGSIQESISSIWYFRNKLVQTTNRDNQTVWIPSFIPLIRTGISIGYAF